MRYFDIADLHEDIDEGLANRLGFKRIFKSGSEIEMVSSAGRDIDKPFLIATLKPEVLYNLITHRNSIGVLLDKEELDKKAQERIRENEKLVIFNTYSVTSDPQGRVERLHRLRKHFRNAHRARLRCGIVSLAQNKTHLLSSMQLMEIAKMITDNDSEAKQMLLNVGEKLNDIQKEE